MGMVKGGAVGARRSEQQWKALVEGFAQSGLSVGEYCRSVAVSEASFYRWRGLLAGTACAQPAHASAKTTGKSVAGFLDLGTLQSGAGGAVATNAAGRLELTLDLGGGLVLRLVRG